MQTGAIGITRGTPMMAQSKTRLSPRLRLLFDDGLLAIIGLLKRCPTCRGRIATQRRSRPVLRSPGPNC